MRGSGRLSLPVRVHRGSLGAPRRPTKEDPAGLTRVPWCRPSWHRPSRLGVVSRPPEVCTAPPEVSTFSPLQRHVTPNEVAFLNIVAGTEPTETIRSEHWYSLLMALVLTSDGWGGWKVDRRKWSSAGFGLRVPPGVRGAPHEVRQVPFAFPFSKRGGSHLSLPLREGDGM